MMLGLHDIYLKNGDELLMEEAVLTNGFFFSTEEDKYPD